MANYDKPLLLVDDNNILSIINEGEFKVFNLTFEEVKAMLDTYPEDAVAKCFSSYELEENVFDFIGAERKNYVQLCMTNLQVDQYAIAFKLYRRPSESTAHTQRKFRMCTYTASLLQELNKSFSLRTTGATAGCFLLCKIKNIKNDIENKTADSNIENHRDCFLD